MDRDSQPRHPPHAEPAPAAPGPAATGAQPGSVDCRTCGVVMPAGSRYCLGCGSQLDGEAGTGPVVTTGPASAPPAVAPPPPFGPPPPSPLPPAAPPVTGCGAGAFRHRRRARDRRDPELRLLL
jgi:hypothetical protein